MQAKDAANLSDEEAQGIRAVTEAMANYHGLGSDEFIDAFIAGIEKGDVGPVNTGERRSSADVPAQGIDIKKTASGDGVLRPGGSNITGESGKLKEAAAARESGNLDITKNKVTGQGNSGRGEALALKLFIENKGNAVFGKKTRNKFAAEYDFMPEDFSGLHTKWKLLVENGSVEQAVEEFKQLQNDSPALFSGVKTDGVNEGVRDFEKYFDEVERPLYEQVEATGKLSAQERLDKGTIELFPEDIKSQNGEAEIEYPAGIEAKKRWMMDVREVIEDELSGELDLLGRSSKSEASYWGFDRDSERIRVAGHNIVHAESDTGIFIGIGEDMVDADFIIKEGMGAGDIESVVKKAVKVFKEKQGNGGETDVLAQEELTDGDGQLNLDGIWYINKQVSIAKKAIQNHPYYKEAEANIRQVANIALGFVSNIDFGANLGDVKDYIDGNAASHKGYLWKYVSSEPGKGQPWDTLAVEIAGAVGFEPMTDVLDFITFIDNMIMLNRTDGGINEAVLELAKSAKDPAFEIDLAKLEMLQNGEEIADINEEIKEIGMEYGIEDSDIEQLLLKHETQYRKEYKQQKKAEEIKVRKAQVEFAEDGKAVIKAFKSADFSSVIHELAHVFRRTMTSEDMQAAGAWAGAVNGEWSIAAEEKFARGFEKYLWEGRAPNTMMQKVFEQFKQWMRKTYDSLKNSPLDIELNKNVRRIFDNMFAVAELHPGAMTFDQFFDKMGFELADPASGWFEKWGIEYGDAPRKAWNKLKKSLRGREAEVVAFAKEKVGSEPVDESKLTEQQKQQILHMELGEFKPNARTVAKNMSLTVEELLNSEEQDAVILQECRKAVAAAFVSGREAGVAKAKKRYSVQKEKISAKKQLRDYMLKLGKTISKRIPKTVDLAYREAIAAMQAGFDPSFRSKKTIAKKDSLLKFIAENPEVKIPADFVKWATKKSINQLTLKELEDLSNERNRLEQLGRKKKKLKLEAENEKIAEIANSLTIQVLKGKSVDRMIKPDRVKEGEMKVVQIGQEGPEKIYKAVYKGKYDVRFWDEAMQMEVVRRWRLKEGEDTQRIIEEAVKEYEKDTVEPITGQTAKQGHAKKTYTEARVNTLGPARVFDLIDGGKLEFGGLMHKTFYDAVNRAWDAKLRQQEVRLEAGNQKLQELGLTAKDLAKLREINGVKYTTQEIMGIHAYSMNAKSRMALYFGNDISSKTIADVQYLCDEQLPELGEFTRWMISEFDQHFDRLDDAFINAQEKGAFEEEDMQQLREQREQLGEDSKLAGLAKEENYFPISRVELDYTPDKRQILNEILERNSLKKAYTEKGFTMSRQDISAEFQKPINLNAFSTWSNQVKKQEHFIHLGGLTADLHRIAGNRDLQASIRNVYGDSFNESIRDYVSRVANPNIYKTFKPWERLSRTLRKNAAVAYLAANVVTMTKQLPSLLYYLPDAGATQLAASAAEFSMHPLKMIEKVRTLDPQLKDAAIDRVLEELKLHNDGKWGQIQGKVSKVGMAGIQMFDAVARTIGWNAVYEKALADGASQNEAIRLAQNSTLRTQPAAASKDLAAIYTNGETMNWILMFTNQLSQMYNMSVYDIPMALKNKQFQKAFYGVAGLSVSALLMWVLSHRELPDEPGEIAEVFEDQALSMIPVFGSALKSAKDGFGGGDIGIMADAGTAYNAVRNIVAGDAKDKDWSNLMEVGGVVLGVPTTQTKRIYRAVTEGEPLELIGMRKR